MPSIDDLLKNFDLKIFKSRKVKTPSKAWEAAGWDFYVPENLSIFDFAESYKAYLDDNVKYDRNFIYYVPLVFYMKSDRTIGEFAAQLTLKWSDIASQWKFGIVDYNDKKKELTLFDEVDNKLISWLTEDETVVSRIEVLPHGSVNIPSGIHVNLPDNIFLQAANKSGIGSKRRLSYLAEIIDPDYEGEIHLNLINESDLSVMINAGEKIIQILPVFQPSMKTVVEFDSLEKLYENKKSARGSGGFGSSGEK